MKYNKIREEELKNKVAADWFSQFDTTEILGNIDFCVFPKQDSLFGRTPLLWAESKTGDFDIPNMFVQLILTIGKARTFDKTFPPTFLGAFDFKKIAFVEYLNIQDIFNLNDFNWNVTPSNHNTKEFQLIKERIESILKRKTYVFDYLKDEKQLNSFIKNNVAKGSTKSKIKIDKNNFTTIYLRWIEIIKPIINVDWDILKKSNILDSDFYLADIFVEDKGTENVDDDFTLRDSLFVVFKNQGYTIAKENFNGILDYTISIKNINTYSAFWKLYKRPPLEKIQDYIIQRRDLLVSQDIRERKGAFFTPRIWVELSQKYLTDYLGEDWQEEYYVWDCAAGTGNLLAGLTNKYNIYASTIDQADINVMDERIDQGANLLKNHVFQFDFLNDDFSKLPQSLQEIINNPVKRKKLLIYINPPYAEADNRTGEGRKGVAVSEIHKKYSDKMGYTKREMYIQFLTRIYVEIPEAVIANFSTLKNLQAPRFKDFRRFYRAKLEKIFLTPAKTFDNVKGTFPIGFFIWDTKKEEDFEFIEADVYGNKAEYIGTKNIWGFDNFKFINDWVKTFRITNSESLATIIGVGSDFQNQRLVRFGEPFMKVPASNHNWQTSKDNLIETSIYYTVRRIIDANWLNDRDQFLWPKDLWKTGFEFQNDCLTHTLFSNNISNGFVINNWIPFTEEEINAQEKFESNFMTDFINGKIKIENETNLFGTNENQIVKREFSEEAKTVFNAGRKLWKYYHSKPNVNVNASLYDIREYFQGRNDKGRMNSKSDDEKYMELIGELRKKLNFLADKIKPKIYEYEFLKL
jgi:hypothetical protein